MINPVRALRAFLGMMVENIRMSVSNITQNRLRSALTILGILIGVTAVIALITTINGVSDSISSSFTSMGAGTLTLTISGSDLKSGLDTSDLETLAALECVDGITPTVSLNARVSKGSVYESSASIAGRNDYWFAVNADAVVRGRTFNYLDMNNMNFVCLISEDMVTEFFYGQDPLDQMIYISGMEFRVVGVFDSEQDTSVSGMMSGSADILIPYTTALKMNGTSLVTSMTVYLNGQYTSEQASSLLESTLDAMFSYESDCYELITMDSLEDTMESMMSMMAALLGGIASIALLVGGIGIMNMMLTSVTERTVEIGLKKALGAKPRQIQAQFLIESFILSLSGGLIGAIFGLALSFGLCKVMGVGFVISQGAIVLGVGFSALVGILFGWAPARKASALNPIEALKRI